MFTGEIGKMKVLILGGGSVGGKLARDLKVPFTLVEADPSRVYQLNQELSPEDGMFDLVVGDGSDIETLKRAKAGDFDVAVILMNKDFENLEATRNLKKLGVNRIIARVNRASNMKSFTELGAEVFVHPVGYEEGIIRTMLFPDSQHAIQIFVREGSPAIGKTIKGLKMPSGSVVSTILRGDELVPPEPDTRIQWGDIIAIDTVGKKARRVWRIFSRSRKEESAGHLLFPVSKNMSISAIKECEMLAKRLGSEILFIVQPGREKMLDSIKGHISKRVPYQLLVSGGDGQCLVDTPTRRSANIRRLPEDKMEINSIIDDHVKEGSPHLDIMVVPGPKNNIFYTPFLNTNLDYLIERSSMPVLVSRCGRPYRKILLYISGKRGQEVSTALQIARGVGCKLWAAYKPRNRKRAQYLRKFAQVYDIDVELIRIRGNPTVEFIKEVKSSHYDLVILKGSMRDFQMSQLKRLTHLWSGSVMVVP